MKTREVNFETRKQLYEWAASGKTIALGSVYHEPDADGDYGFGFSFSHAIERYTGIEEVPIKKAYAYWCRNEGAHARYLLFYEKELTNIHDKHLHERAVEFDMETKE